MFCIFKSLVLIKLTELIMQNSIPDAPTISIAQPLLPASGHLALSHSPQPATVPSLSTAVGQYPSLSQVFQVTPSGGGRVRGHRLAAGYILQIKGKIQVPPSVVGQEAGLCSPSTRSPITPWLHSPPSPGWRTRHWREPGTGMWTPGGSSGETLGYTHTVIGLQLGGDWHCRVLPARSTQVRLNPLPESEESEWKTILTLVTRWFY